MRECGLTEALHAAGFGMRQAAEFSRRHTGPRTGTVGEIRGGGGVPDWAALEPAGASVPSKMLSMGCMMSAVWDDVNAEGSDGVGRYYIHMQHAEETCTVAVHASRGV